MKNTALCSAQACARVVLDYTPEVMRSVRAQMRKHRSADLSIPEFRVLSFVRRRPGASLSEVSQQLGTSLPTISKLVTVLASRGLISRAPSEADRRRQVLVLTAWGAGLLESAEKGAQAQLARRLAGLSHAERRGVVQALSTLVSLFASEDGSLK